MFGHEKNHLDRQKSILAMTSSNEILWIIPLQNIIKLSKIEILCYKCSNDIIRSMYFIAKIATDQILSWIKSIKDYRLDFIEYFEMLCYKCSNCIFIIFHLKISLPKYFFVYLSDWNHITFSCRLNPKLLLPMYLVQKFQGVNQKGVIRKLLHGIILFNWIKNYPKHFVICVEEFFW